MIYRILYIILYALLLVGSACQMAEPEVKTYLFLGHPYDWNYPNRIDYRLEQVDYTQFDQIWLGGDVCSATTQEAETVTYLDSLFSLSEKVHWTLGNHDLKYEQVERITNATQKPEFYATWQDGICLLVLNTNYYWWYDGPPPQENCAAKEGQWQLLQTVCDTISEASHLVVLHHHGVLNELKRAPSNAFNINATNIRMTCDSLSDFTNWVYPLLQQVQEHGTQVILIGGDIGMVAKKYEYQTPEGIWLLGSGINNTVNKAYAPDYVTNFEADEVLVLTHDVEQQRLEWDFLLLEEVFLPKYKR
ncbi:MAG: metallophosphoesterase [Bacteroidota bacterium]